MMVEVVMNLRTSALLLGAIIITAYVIFGTPTFTTTSNRRKRKKDNIPGLANIGNSCFLNALVQSLASCPLFITWLASKYSHSAPPLVSALHSLLQVLNNESDFGGDACAGEVLSALRGHGWVISSEEQDTHELFHVLTATIDDELTSATAVPSLLDVSWMEVNCVDSLDDGVVLKANSWQQTGEQVSVKEVCVDRMELQPKNTANIGKRSDNFSYKINGILIEGKYDKPHVVTTDGTKTYSQLNKSESVNDTRIEVLTNDLICDQEGCEGNSMLEEKCCNLQSLPTDSFLHNSWSLVNKNNIVNMKHGNLNLRSTCDTTVECDNINKCTEHKSDVEAVRNIIKNSEDYVHNFENNAVGAAPIAARPRDAENTCRKIHNDQHDSPFRGYLVSQLQCTVCGHKNSAQWTSFESLSLSLPTLPWGEVTVQELLDSYITQEQVTEVTCESCTKKSGSSVKTTFTKQLTIGKLPDCLCVHIKRTVWLENGTAIKRRDHLVFPEFLIMDPYTYATSITTQGLQNCKVSGRDCSSDSSSSYWSQSTHQLPISSIISQSATATHIEPSPFVHVRRVRYEQLYRLKAVIVHVGDVFCGHFVTYRRGPIGSRTRNRWFYTSDLLVREASLEEVRKANAYMILYEKVT